MKDSAKSLMTPEQLNRKVSALFGRLGEIVLVQVTISHLSQTTFFWWYRQRRCVQEFGSLGIIAG